MILNKIDGGVLKRNYNGMITINTGPSLIMRLSEKIKYLETLNA